MTVQYTTRRARVPARYPNQIRNYRLTAGLTQRELAVLIGASRPMVSAWERGHAIPPLPCLFRIARGLDTVAEHLYQEIFNAARLKHT